MTEPTKEQTESKVAALIEERRGYVVRDDTARIALVDAELKRLGAEGKPPAKRASTRVKKADESR